MLWDDFDITTPPSIPVEIYLSLSIPSTSPPVSLWDDSTITITGIPDTIHSSLSFPSTSLLTECNQFLLANVVQSFDDVLFEPTIMSPQQPRTSSPQSIPPSITSMLSNFKSLQSKSSSSSSSPLPSTGRRRSRRKQNTPSPTMATRLSTTKEKKRGQSKNNQNPATTEYVDQPSDIQDYLTRGLGYDNESNIKLRRINGALMNNQAIPPGLSFHHFRESIPFWPSLYLFLAAIPSGDSSYLFWSATLFGVSSYLFRVAIPLGLSSYLFRVAIHSGLSLYAFHHAIPLWLSSYFSGQRFLQGFYYIFSDLPSSPCW